MGQQRAINRREGTITQEIYERRITKTNSKHPYFLRKWNNGMMKHALMGCY
jgi:hypothetical protein